MVVTLNLSFMRSGSSAPRATVPCLLALALLSASVRADISDEFKDSEDGMLDASDYLSSHLLGFLPVPRIITEPAVGYGLGLAAIFFHESEAQKAQQTSGAAAETVPVLPENISLLAGGATANGTWAVGGGHLGFWREDRIRYRGGAGYANINLDFYSLGGVDLPRPVELNLAGPGVMQQLSFRMGESEVFVGVNQLYRRVETSVAHDDDSAATLPPQFDDYLARHLDLDTTTSGLGVNIEYDSVNNKFNPEAGYDWKAKATWFEDHFGSDVDYAAYNVTALNYWQLPKDFLLGLRLQYDAVSAGDDARLPPYVPPFIDMRGIPASRYQGNSVALAEIQIGWKPHYRWTLSLFTGAGRAADRFGDLDDAPSHTAKGIGFRYLIARRYGFAMGVDVARGPEDTAFYFQAGSAWQ